MTLIDELEWSWRKIGLNALVLDQRFQPRVDGVSTSVVNKYASDLSRGAKFPPILVGRIDKELYVLDGFHRVEAAYAAGLDEIASRVASMSLETAIWVAVEANATHGKNLTRKDKRRCFEQYCAIGRHLTMDGDVKSLRRIRADLNNIAQPQTISNWLKKAGIVPSPDPHHPVKEWSRYREEELAELIEVESHVAALEKVYSGLDEADRLTAVGLIRSLANRLAAKESDPPPFLDV